MAVPTVFELIEEHGIHCGARVICSSCRKTTLYAVQQVYGPTLYLCRFCDTTKDQRAK